MLAPLLAAPGSLRHLYADIARLADTVFNEREDVLISIENFARIDRLLPGRTAMSNLADEYSSDVEILPWADGLVWADCRTGIPKTVGYVGDTVEPDALRLAAARQTSPAAAKAGTSAQPQPPGLPSPPSAATRPAPRTR